MSCVTGATRKECVVDEALKCVLCDGEAITTAVYMPVCGDHYRAYQEEGGRYLPQAERKIYNTLRMLADSRMTSP